MLQLERPLAVIDLETTGTNVEKDRIVSLSIVRRLVDGRRDFIETLVNPTIPISTGAYNVHGISDLMVQGKPTFADIAAAVADYLDNCDLTGYGILMFDVPLLCEEFRRTQIPFSIEGRSLIDSQQIFFSKEPRTLAGAVKFFCNKELKNAHNSTADALAADEVLDGQLARYSDLPRTVKELGQYCVPKDFVDLDGKLKRRGDGTIYLNFGNQHFDEDITSVALRDPSYLTWIIGAQFSPVVKEECRKALRARGYKF
jgi:DNA polymerase III subunit epsilon